MSEYQKLDQIEHIHLRPDMYIGSLKPKKEQNEWVSTMKATNIKQVNNIKYSQGLVRIFVEAVSNSIDNVWRSKDTTPCKNIKITINRDTGETSVWNDGMCIPVTKNTQTGLYNPNLIFGHLLTSSNYDDTQDRYTSGRNGLGIKLTNVFSKEFTIDCSDGNKRYQKRWSNNMRDNDEEKISNCKKKGYTYVTWIPDFEKFDCKEYSNNIIKIYNKVILDTAMITKINVFLNDEKINIKSLLEYTKLYNKESQSICFKSSDCEVVLTDNTENEEYEFIPFTNGVFNKDGGIHVDKWTEDIFRPIINKLNKPNKPQITMKDVKKFFRIFINCIVKNPEFTSQSKTYLSHPEIHTNVTPNNINSIMKWGVINSIKDIIRGKELLTLKKTEKKRKFVKIDGYDASNNAGGKYSKDCTLIVCEGLSAKTYAVSGIQVGYDGKKGRDWFGAYALRGKLLNVRNANMSSISKNKEISDLVNALNLKYDTDYTDDKNFNNLNYGYLMIMTDADHDGIHIASLIMNVFHFLFPSLLKREKPFIISMQTPIIKVLNKNMIFYREEHYQKYLRDNRDSKLQIKYYKGLGTSSDREIKDTFGKYVINFLFDEHTNRNMNLVFNNKQADDRKEWMTNYKEKYPEENIKNMNISDYLNDEQIKFSINDCGRSLPNVYDGFKESHRKILYSLFLKNCSHSIKVAQLAGYVAEQTNYHHGEQNLFDTITKLAQDFVGSNNIPYLEKDGQFGTRLSGGKDAANARYIFTKLSKITRLIFPKQDDELLDYVYEEGKRIEPKYYVPIIPMILVNGCRAGIGTGWSTSIPCYNPKDIIELVRNWIRKENMKDIMPYYKGFTGNIVKVSNNKYETIGKVEIDGNNVKVTELPIMMWIDKYKEFCEGLLEKKKIKNFKNHSTPTKVHFEFKSVQEMSKDDLKIKSVISTGNMVLFKGDKLSKFEDVKDIIDCFCRERMSLYEKRKRFMINSLEKELSDMREKHRFISLVVNDNIVIFRRTEESIIKRLREYNFEEKESNYNYLLNININKFTKTYMEKIEKDISEKDWELSDIVKQSEKDVWMEELTELEKYL